MYVANVNRVYRCCAGLTGPWELFLTVHPTENEKSPEQQAVVLVRMLNKSLKELDATS